VRDGRQRQRPFGDERLQPGDVLLVRTSPEQIVAFREDRGVELHPVAQYEQKTERPAGNGEDELADRLVQAVVAPSSELSS
jgi:hypothetical protein